MTRSCGECYRCCVAFGIRELKKHQDQACRHLDGRNPTARCSIYADRPACCRDYLCLWREGHFREEDRPDVYQPFAQIMYRRVGSNVVLIQTRDGETGTFSYVVDLETGIRFTARFS